MGAKGQAKTNSKRRIPKRQRFQQRFWLDYSKDDERAIGEHCDDLKHSRQWQPSVRDALKLLYSLRERKVDVLLALFPWVDEYFRAKYDKQESLANAEFARYIEQQTAINARQTDILALIAAGGVQRQPININNNVAFELAEKSAFVTDAPPADPTEARTNFTKGMGNLFSDDDDTWND